MLKILDKRNKDEKKYNASTLLIQVETGTFTPLCKLHKNKGFDLCNYDQYCYVYEDPDQSREKND